jgi:hypothetical protein
MLIAMGGKLLKIKKEPKNGEVEVVSQAKTFQRG